MAHKHQRVLLRIGLEGRAAWREASIIARTVLIGKAVTISMPDDVIAEIQNAGKRVKVLVQPVQFYDAPDPNQLYVARMALLSLAPADLRALFEEIRNVRTWEEWDAYEQRLVEAVLARATTVSTTLGERAPCPLCNEESREPYPSGGFAFPNGLIWHLTGRTPARRCIVTQALYEWYRDR